MNAGQPAKGNLYIAHDMYARHIAPPLLVGIEEIMDELLPEGFSHFGFAVQPRKLPNRLARFWRKVTRR